MIVNLLVGNRYSTFSTEFDDFFITSIGGDTQTATQFWGILVNFEFTSVGGCRQEVNANDDILFAFDAFNANAFLKLTGPATATPNRPAFFTVTDGQTGKPVAGATLAVKGPGAPAVGTSDSNGQVSVTFQLLSVVQVKATRPGSIRSNQLTVLVV